MCRGGGNETCGVDLFSLAILLGVDLFSGRFMGLTFFASDLGRVDVFIRVFRSAGP